MAHDYISRNTASTQRKLSLGTQYDIVKSTGLCQVILEMVSAMTQMQEYGLYGD